VGQAFVANFSVSDIAAQSERAVASRNRVTNPASVVFPSQANQPRGVVATHASLARMARWAKEQFDVRGGDRHAATSVPGSDRALFETVIALASGAGLQLTVPDLSQPRRAAEFLRRERLTQWLTTAEILSRMAEADVVLPGDFPALRRVLWFAEPIAPSALRYWMRRVGHARFTSLFGAPETATVSACHTWGQEPGAGEPAMPVGAPRQGQQVLVLNAGLEPVNTDEVGDVWVRGAGLSPGYWRDTAATAQAFHQVPSAGGERMWRTGRAGRRAADGQLHFVATLESGASA
jgi:non-ribosomal peptide synthetase component F